MTCGIDGFVRRISCLNFCEPFASHYTCYRSLQLVAGGLAGGVVVYGVEGVIFRVVCRVVVIAVVRLGGVVVGVAVMVVVGHYLLQGGGS